jgi:hypothetical protein
MAWLLFQRIPADKRPRSLNRQILNSRMVSYSECASSINSRRRLFFMTSLRTAYLTFMIRRPPRNKFLIVCHGRGQVSPTT